MIGMGAALIPRIGAKDELDKGTLRDVKLQDERFPHFYSQMIMHKNTHPSKLIPYLASLFH